MKKALFLSSTCLLLGLGNVSVAHPVVLGENPRPTAEKESSESWQSEKPEAPTVKPEESGSAPMVKPINFKTVNEAIEIEIVERGARPRRKLRFRPEVGQVQQVRMQMTVTTDVKVNGRTMPAIAIPTIEMRGTAEMTQVDKDGTSYLSYSYDEPKVLESEEEPSFFGSMLKPMLEQQFKQLADTKIKFVYDKQGRIIETDVEFSGERDPSTDKLLQQLSNSTYQSSGVLPKKSVGVGAVWTAPQKVTIQGMDLSQMVTYKLLKMDQETVTVSMDFEMEDNTNSFQEFFKTFPTPPGAEMNVSLFDISGTGTMTMDLSQLVASEMDMSTDARILMSMKTPNQEDSVVEMDMSSTITIIPEESETAVLAE